MNEVETWLKLAETTNASYKGLVADHNSKFACLYSQNPL